MLATTDLQGEVIYVGSESTDLQLELMYVQFVYVQAKALQSTSERTMHSITIAQQGMAAAAAFFPWKSLPANIKILFCGKLENGPHQA